MWTGLTANMTAGATGPLSKAALLANVSSSMRTSVENCMNKRNNAQLPVYVIADRWAGEHFLLVRVCVVLCGGPKWATCAARDGRHHGSCELLS